MNSKLKNVTVDNAIPPLILAYRYQVPRTAIVYVIDNHVHSSLRDEQTRNVNQSIQSRASPQLDRHILFIIFTNPHIHCQGSHEDTTEQQQRKVKRKEQK
jgi:hypothetical protein